METKGKLRMSDSYIFGWNSRIFETAKDLGVMVSATYTNQTGIDVKIRPSVSNSMIMSSLGASNEEVLLDPPVKYKLVVSVAKDGMDDFDEITESLSQKTFDNHVWKTSNSSSRAVVIPTKTVSINKVDHVVGGIEYIRHEWRMMGTLSEVMASCYIIETAVEIFGKCWGFTAEGDKVSMMKFPVGSMVCVDGDKSTDWLVLDYCFDLSSPSFSSTYDVISFQMGQGSAVVKYDKRMLVVEGRISWSRNGRIDEILD